jgi:hypothetical protein
MTLPRIQAIVSVQPLTIVARWTNGEVRCIDFSRMLAAYEDKPNSSLGKLLQPEVFCQVSLDPEMQTLRWEGLINQRKPDGSLEPAQLDICPDVLFENSHLLT